MCLPVSLLTIFFAATLALANVYDRFESLPAVNYDFVVIGGEGFFSTLSLFLTDRKIETAG
jgi:hypothetical protein